MITDVYSFLIKFQVTFCCIEMSILSVNLNNINLDDTSCEEDDPDAIILVRLLG